MIVIRVQLQVKPDDKRQLIDFMKDSVTISRRFDGCVRYAFYEDVTDENAFILYEEWESQTKFDTYRESEHFKESGKVIFPLLNGEPDSAYFTADKLQ